MKSYSQHGEDLWIVENLKPEIGRFCEVGAFDGIGCSNTLMFEELGWTGVCIEPIIENAAKCFLNRRCHTVCCAIDTCCAKLDLFHYNNLDFGAGGLANHSKAIHTRSIPVPILRLDDIFRLLYPGIGVSLLSIDTEGTEINVLISLEDYRPEIIIAEYQTFDNPPNDYLLGEYAKDMGYKEVHRTACNLIFHRKS